MSVDRRGPLQDQHLYCLHRSADAPPFPCLRPEATVSWMNFFVVPTPWTRRSSPSLKQQRSRRSKHQRVRPPPLTRCCVSLDHARGLRALVREALPAPAIGLMRLQYEALTRSVWLLYAAPDSAVEKLRTTLTPAAEKTASRLPMLSEMLDAIEGKAPSDATQMLREFKDVQAGALNSYVHAGIHALVRQSEGYPVPLMIQVLRSSNGLLTMNGMVLAILSGDPELAKRMSGIQLGFSDCLPALLPAVGK